MMSNTVINPTLPESLIIEEEFRSQNQDARSLLASPLLTLGEANAKGEDSL
ncbi:hypothetical protein [uncultured Nostoc sp.]